MKRAGGIEAVILDWAGTTLDFGSRAPVEAFRRVFATEGVPISSAEARVPMGANKRHHIEQLTELPSVRDRWLRNRGSMPGEADVARMFEAVVPIQIECLSRYSELIPGTLSVVAALHARGIRIGTTTGYTSEMMAVNLRDAAAQGYTPDATVCASDVPIGRPLPYMCLLNVIRLGVRDVRACVKVDDTLPGIAEGLSAGMWTIGVAVSGNEVGLSLADWEQLRATERERLRRAATLRMLAAGADFVVDTIADILPCLEVIEGRGLKARGRIGRAAAA